MAAMTKIGAIISILLALAICSITRSGEAQKKLEESPPNKKRVCVISASGIPEPFWFDDSISLTDLIVKAGIRRNEVGKEVTLLRVNSERAVTMTVFDLKNIEKGKANNPMLQDFDLVYLKHKEKQPQGDSALVLSACEICGCHLFPGIHGPLLVPGRNGTP